MEKKLILSLLGVAVFLGAVGYLFGPNSPRNKGGSPTPISLQGKTIEINGKTIPVELANNSEKRQKGLSNRSSLPQNTGLLFVFDQKAKPTFWMKDMNFAIDIIWISDGKIVGIDKNAQPEPGKADNELKLFYAPTLIDYVLEINAGESDKNGFKVGDLVEFNI